MVSNVLTLVLVRDACLHLRGRYLNGAAAARTAAVSCYVVRGEHGDSLRAASACSASRPALSRISSHSQSRSLLSVSEMSLRGKSDEEISKLLAEYGIKHGPIVDSTRELYERKLIKAMASAPVKPSSDKTYYREEEEEITYITYQNPVHQEVHRDMLKRRGNIEPDEDEESEPETEPTPQIMKRTANHSTARSREPVKKSGGSMWKMIRLLLLLVVLAAVLFYAYSRVISNEEVAIQS